MHETHHVGTTQHASSIPGAVCCGGVMCSVESMLRLTAYSPGAG
jgi:hypothetical protein